MKPLCKLLCLTLCLLALTGAALAEHVHSFSPWQRDENAATHSAVCAECGETASVKCSVVSRGFQDPVNVCTVCGAYPGGVFDLLDASAAAEKENAPAQKGQFIMRGKAQPFEDQPQVLYALTQNFALNGSSVTIKNRNILTAAIDGLPEGFHLTRISVSSGDDSTTGSTSYAEADYTYENGRLVFAAKTPALYVITADAYGE